MSMKTVRIDVDNEQFGETPAGSVLQPASEFGAETQRGQKGPATAAERQQG